MNSFRVIFYIMLILCWIIMVGASAFVPYYCQRSIAFGISIPESHCEDSFLVCLRRRYCITTLVTGVILGGLCIAVLFLFSYNTAPWIQLGGLLLFLLIQLSLYFKAHRNMADYKKQSGWLVKTKVTALLLPEEEVKAPLHIRWLFTYAGMIAVTLAATVLRYRTLPAKIPMHYDIAGNVDRYASKASGAIISIPLTQIIIGLLFVGLFYATAHAKIQSAGGTQEKGMLRDYHFRAAMVNFIFVAGLLGQLVLTVTQFGILGLISAESAMLLTPIFLVVIIGYSIYFTVKAGRDRHHSEKAGKEHADESAESDRFWVGGLLYYNKNDPTLFVRKRFGVGYTVNFGNRKVLLALAALVLVMIILSF